MLAVVDDPIDPTTIDDILPLITEVRDFLLSEGQLTPLTDLIRVLKRSKTCPPAFLISFANEAALRRILHSVPKGVEDAPPELVAMLDLLPADHLSHLIDLLAFERGETARRIARQLIARYRSRKSAANSLAWLAGEVHHR